jgi:1-deoxy-D-xylulose-5-phosphate reductoisomerase
MKRIALLGSTGSIGHSTLDVVRQYPGRFRVAAIAGGMREELLMAQAKEFKPGWVCAALEGSAVRISRALGRRTKVVWGREGLCEIAGAAGIDEVVMAVTGAAALPPLMEAVRTGKDVVLANKEALVMAGPLIMGLAQRKKVAIKPVDSEQSAVWQCLHGQQKRRVKAIYLTASGGPFRNLSRSQMRRITVAQALAHPRWSMGRKITVDSATLMNKGLEFLEAMYLFGVPAEQVKVVIHPEAIIHSMVEFIDGVVMAQLSTTDMRIPIQYALTYPDRLECPQVEPLDFVRLGTMHFEAPDLERFPALALAYRAARYGGTMPCVLNAADEVAVQAFLQGGIGFSAIPDVVERTMRAHRKVAAPSLRDIEEADAWARRQAQQSVGAGTGRGQQGHKRR